jgi:hypothetical protein
MAKINDESFTYNKTHEQFYSTRKGKSKQYRQGGKPSNSNSKLIPNKQLITSWWNSITISEQQQVASKISSFLNTSISVEKITQAMEDGGYYENKELKDIILTAGYIQNIIL